MIPAQTIVTLHPVNLALPAVHTHWRFSAVASVTDVPVGCQQLSSAAVAASASPMSPTAAEASIGSASGTATTSMSAVLGSFASGRLVCMLLLVASHLRDSAPCA